MDMEETRKLLIDAKSELEKSATSVARCLSQIDQADAAVQQAVEAREEAQRLYEVAKQAHADGAASLQAAVEAFRTQYGQDPF